MKEHNYFDDKKWNRTDFVYDFTDKSGPKVLEFFSADQPYKVRGPRRDVLFINEANNVNYETFTQLEIRTNDIIWLDWNPVSEFWFYAGENGEMAVKDREDTDFIILTYKDNESLPESIIKTIEARKGNKNWWLVYGEGQLGEAEGRIYTGWNIVKDTPHEARLERRGLDFGYTNDPTAIVAVYYYNGGYILDEELYQKGLSNKQIADVINNLFQPNSVVIADSAEPKSIDEISLYGIPIIPTVKGRDSVNQGIQYVQDQRISVTERSVNLLKEYRNYLWDVDRDGKTLNKPIGFYNHCMDAIRYAFEALKPPLSESQIRSLPQFQTPVDTDLGL